MATFLQSMFTLYNVQSLHLQSSQRHTALPARLSSIKFQKPNRATYLVNIISLDLLTQAHIFPRLGTCREKGQNKFLHLSCLQTRAKLPSDLCG